MLLKKIIIENYRSIEHLEIDIREIAGCKFHSFFGINEAGKSNILKAIALLSPDKKVEYNNDCNKSALKKSKPIILRYIFGITKEDELEKKLASYDISLTLPTGLTNVSEPYYIEKIIQFGENSHRQEGYVVHQSKGVSDILQPDDEENWGTFLGKLIVGVADYADRTNLEKIVNEQAKAAIDTLIPQIIYWKYSDEYLITNPINLENFKNNPDTSIPLKHIFQLFGYNGEDIAKIVARIQTSFDIRREVERDLSKAITDHINEIWSDHPINIGIRMESNNLCDIYVEDKDNTNQTFSMEQRSDGFKQFISILLSISIKNKAKQLKNNIILLDEPEISLHPGSIKCLRDELMQIGIRNIVLASSHSIFMVDKKNLDRHYTVKKDNSKTVIKKVDPKNPLEDEVIYNALGTSIFELIQPNILVLEGRTDKDIFDIFTDKFEDEIQPAKIQTIVATGTGEIAKYVNFFHSRFINGFVLVDSDNAGRGALESIRVANAEFTDNSFELKDFVDISKRDAEMEDILPENLVISSVNGLYGLSFTPTKDKPIMSQIKAILRTQSESKYDPTVLKKHIVQTVINDIRSKSVGQLKDEYPTYVQFLTNIHAKIKEVE
ncbi:AAA family ATPase [Methanococcoides alaskense]|uniref:AAA15 family ATPase/GTPase n=1 Tax=Methanococcoides alaskense TaxID=325778 RepID=A0AA90TXX5_9EURY|nr:ATP-binding protein [Methanococcoides alaskense]MDA0525173.1 AAA family ATPase [Methanococcoides alaskense]MDR6221906.1 AAA15 family ATPase/GTPase [Methanococcoides alaskense]